MIHKITIRELNTLGNQLPQNNPIRKIIHLQVLEAVDAKVPYILLDDKDEVDIALLKGIKGAKILEKESKRAAIKGTSFQRDKQKLGGPWEGNKEWYLPL